MLIVVLIIALLLSECILRLLGYQPRPQNVSNFSKSSASLYQLNNSLAYQLAPGQHQLNHLNTIITNINVWDNRSRATQNSPIETDCFQSEIHLYGCSNTFGYNLEDSSTMAWKLNATEHFKVLNFGCPGYGLLQMYLWMKMNFKSGLIPNYVVINYGSFQDQRSVLSGNWQNTVTQNNSEIAVKYPYCRIKNKELTMAYKTPQTYHFAGSQHLSLANFLEQKYFAVQSCFLKDKEVARQLLSEIQQLTANHQVQLILCGIDTHADTKEVIEWCKANKIKAFDIGLDITIPKYNLLPDDVHPNELANTLYAKQFMNYFYQMNDSTYK